MEENIYTALLKIQNEVRPILKDISIGGATAKYKAVSALAVLEETRKRFIEHEILYYPIAHEFTSDKGLTTALVTYKFFHVPSATSIETSSIGQGQDKYDKGAGKASTYADKYMIMRLLHMVTGEDPDYVGTDDHDKESLKDDYYACKQKLEDQKLDHQIDDEYFKKATDRLTTYWESQNFQGMAAAKQKLGL